MKSVLGCLSLLVTTLLYANQPTLLRKADGSSETVAPRSAGPHSYIVEFAEPPALQTAARLKPGATQVTAYRATFAQFRRDISAARVTHEYFRTFNGAAAVLDDAQVAAVRKLRYVKRVVEDYPVNAFAGEDKEHLARIGAPRVWDERATRGAGITIAIIDTGVDYRHPALGGGLGPGFKVIGGEDFVDGDDDPMDEHGHGTHVAGIAAGNGQGGVLGVAPDAKLLAFRVLNENGQGSTANIIAGLEAAVDPNHDGDFSDHVDVANLSLGGRGDADDPSSLAVDSTVRAGVVVCLAAGNDGLGQTIGAPAASRLAITVGNADATDAVAPSSSRGPSFPDLGLKPEIVAPGTAIMSAKLGGGTLTASGTSMASPHVAGAAALLLALHRDWTPAQVKAALVANADRVGAEIMAQGGGRLNVAAAAGDPVTVEPSAFTFGNGHEGEWTATRMVTVTNRGASVQSFTATADSAAGLTLIADPAAFELAPGASRPVALTATVAAAAQPSAMTLSLGGHVTFRSAESAAHVAFVAIDAAQVALTYDTQGMQVAVGWACEKGTFVDGRHDGDERWNALLPYRQCGLSVVGFDPSLEHGTVALFESHRITDDLALHRSPADSLYKVQVGGVDEQGRVLVGKHTPEKPYWAMYDFHPGSYFNGIGTLSSAPLYINALPEATRLSVSEAYYDLPNHRIYSIHHHPLQGVSSDVTLSTLPADLRHVRISIPPQDPGLWLSGHILWSRDGLALGQTAADGIPISAGWVGDAYVTPEPDPTAWVGAALQTTHLRLPDPFTDLTMPPLRVANDRIALSYDAVPGPTAYSVAPEGTLRFGAAPLFPATFVDARDTAFAVFPSFYGPAGEQIPSAGKGLQYAIYDTAGTALEQGTVTGYVTADFGRRDAYRVTMQSSRGAQLALLFDTSREDWSPPTLTSLRIVGADGAIATRFVPGSTTTLAFSVGDYSTSGYTGAIRAVHASWRTGDGAWRELPIELRIEDGTGRHYRADLSAVTAAAALGAIDLRVDADDASGNSFELTLPDVLAASPRRRSVRK